MRDRFPWARLLAFVTGLVNQELLLRNEYLVAENRILTAHLARRLRLSDAERSTLAEIAKRLGRRALKDIARVAKPDTVGRQKCVRSCCEPLITMMKSTELRFFHDGTTVHHLTFDRTLFVQP